jgi:HD-like signal output (HDOD) protein
VQDQIWERIEALPPLSQIVMDLLQLSQKGFLTAADLVRTVERDPALQGRVLAWANHSRPADGARLETLPEAIVHEGMGNVKNLVYAAATEDLLDHDLPAYCLGQPDFWLHSVAVGVLSCALTEASGRIGLNGEQAFLAGLLHDAGKVVMDNVLTPAAAEGAGQTCAAEVVACGLDHAELADPVLHHWDIPVKVRQAARFHHDPRPEGRFQPAAALLFLANSAVKALGPLRADSGTGETLDPAAIIPLEPEEALLDALNLPASRFGQVLAEIQPRLAGLNRRLCS